MAGLLYALTVAAGVAGAGVGVAGMLGITWTVRVDGIVPLGGLELTMDPLAGFFLAVIGVCVAAASGLPPGRSPDQLSCPMAVIFPPFVAPIRMR